MFPYPNQQGGELAAFEPFNTQTHDRWCAGTTYRKQGMKVRIEGNNNTALLRGMIKNGLIAGRCQANLANVSCILTLLSQQLGRRKRGKP